MGEAPKDGGPAFPCDGRQHTKLMSGEGGPGMTLRDWFAGQALAGGMVAIGYDKETQIVRWHDFAADCYRAADAMLEARK